MFDSVESDEPRKRVHLSALFLGFLKVSLFGFGGGLAWARRIVVETEEWMDEREFVETLTLCQLMPGPNIVGITVCVGAKLRGPVGAIAALAGFILVPWTIGLAVGAIALQHAQSSVLQHILGGISAAAAGLLIGTGLRLLLSHRGQLAALLLAALAFAGMAFTKLPLPVVLVGLAPLSVLLTARPRTTAR